MAIKVLPELFAKDADPSTGSGSSRAGSRDERLARFTREAQTLAALNHPNIAQIYGLEGGPSTGSGQAGTIVTRAMVHAALGEMDTTVALLQQGIEKRESFIFSLRSLPEMAPLMKDPRAQRIVAEADPFRKGM